MDFTIEKFESKKDENQTIAYCRLFKKIRHISLMSFHWDTMIIGTQIWGGNATPKTEASINVGCRL